MRNGTYNPIQRIFLASASLILGLLISLIVLGAVIYFFRPQNRFFRVIERAVPFPALVVGRTQWISYGDFEDNVDSVRRFYENQDFSQIGMRVDFNTLDGRKRLKIKEKEVLEKMTEDAFIESIAHREGIRITAETLAENVDREVDKRGNREAVLEELSRLYGLNLNEFKEKIVRPELYREALEERYLEKYQPKNEARQKIEAAEKELIAKRKSFASVVREFSDGSTTETGGELGWFKKEMLVPEIAEQIFSLERGERSPILESRLGFHIIELEERKTENDEELVRIRQIFAAKPNFADWLSGEMKNIPVWVFLRDYRWNAQEQRIEFKDQALTEYEEQLRSNPQGDASAIL